MSVFKKLAGLLFEEADAEALAQADAFFHHEP